MAYENYRFVAWANATPITGERLGQMSTNIEQVREANDDKPFGLLRITSNTASPANISNQGQITLVSISSTNSVTVAPNRYFRLTINFPGVRLSNAGGENSIYTLTLWNGPNAAVGIQVASWEFTPHTYSYFPGSVGSNVNTETLKTNGGDHRSVIGAGVYSFVTTSPTSGLTNEAYSVSIKRTLNSGASNIANFAPYAINSSNTSPVQFYIEDIGGAVTA